jgi:hypothetical protein
MVVTAGEDLPANVLTNHTYAESKRYLARHAGFGGERPVPKSLTSLDRFVRAAALTKVETESPPVERAFEILESVRIPGYSKWNIVYEPAARRVHFRTDGRPKIRTVALEAFDGGCAEPVRGLDLASGGEGDVAAAFQIYDRETNAKLARSSLKALVKTLPDRALDRVVAHPDTTACAPR